jgi:hypothetical protein
MFLATSASALPPHPPDCYTNAQARTVAAAAPSVFSLDRPLTAPQVLARLHLDRKRLFEQTSCSLNMGYWETYSLSPHYELWLVGATEHPSGTYYRAFIAPRNPKRRFSPPR